MAVLFAVEKFRPYIEGTKFTIITDHWSLLWLMTLKDPHGRVGRWVLKLQQFDFDIVHRKGKENVVPDILSRDTLDPENRPEDDEILNLDITSVKSDTIVDPWILKMKSNVEKYPLKFPSWRLQNNELYKYVPSKYNDLQPAWKRVIPKTERVQIISKNHDDPLAGHPGVFKTFKRISQNYYWPRMAADIAKYVAKCTTCCKNKPLLQKPAGLMSSHPIPSEPWEWVSCDFIGPLPRSNNGFKNILVITDHFSKFVIIRPLRNTSSKVLCKVMEEEFFLIFGQPKTLLCDNGPQLKSKEFRELLNSYGVTQKFTAHYHAQANPTERTNQTLETMLRCYISDNHKCWDQELHKIACAIRTQVHETTKFTPYSVVFGRDMPTNVCKAYDSSVENDDSKSDISMNNVQKSLKKRQVLFQKLYSDIRIRMNNATVQNKKRYDLRRTAVSFNVGDKVYVKNKKLSDASQHYASKLAPLYEGPFVIRGKPSLWTYELWDSAKKKTKGVWHAKDLKLAP